MQYGKEGESVRTWIDNLKEYLLPKNRKEKGNLWYATIAFVLIWIVLFFLQYFQYLAFYTALILAYLFAWKNYNYRLDKKNDSANDEEAGERIGGMQALDILITLLVPLLIGFVVLVLYINKHNTYSALAVGLFVLLLVIYFARALGYRLWTRKQESNPKSRISNEYFELEFSYYGKALAVLAFYYLVKTTSQDQMSADELFVAWVGTALGAVDFFISVVSFVVEICRGQ